MEEFTTWLRSDDVLAAQLRERMDVGKSRAVSSHLVRPKSHRTINSMLAQGSSGVTLLGLAGHVVLVLIVPCMHALTVQQTPILGPYL